MGELPPRIRSRLIHAVLEEIDHILCARKTGYGSRDGTGRESVVETSSSPCTAAVNARILAEDLGPDFGGNVSREGGTCDVERVRVSFLNARSSEGFAGIAAPAGVERA